MKLTSNIYLHMAAAIKSNQILQSLAARSDFLFSREQRLRLAASKNAVKMRVCQRVWRAAG